MIFEPFLLSSTAKQDTALFIKRLAQLNRRRNSRPVDTSILEDVFERLFTYNDKLTIVVYEFYIDKIYRDCYYHHYSGKHFSQSRYCGRVFLFSGDQIEALSQRDAKRLECAFIGCMVIQPTQNGIIGRSLFDPQYFFPRHSSREEFTYIRTSIYDVSFYGIHLSINAFPYMMQDSETMSCAEVSISVLVEYYCNQYNEYKALLPSDIYNISLQYGFERVLPTRGMTYNMITKVLTEIGFYPRLYMTSSHFPSVQQARILHYYVESAIPVLVEIKTSAKVSHSIVCVGHGQADCKRMLSRLQSVSPADRDPDCYKNDENRPKRFYFADTANAFSDYIVMDDGNIPYCSYSFGSELDITNEKKTSIVHSQIDALIVPLYKRMFLEAADAYDICREIISGESHFLTNAYYDYCRAHNLTKLPNLGTEANPLIIRLFMASSRSFMSYRASRFAPRSITEEIYMNTPVPKFVWVCELYDAYHYKKNKVIGEIVLDATASSSTKTSSILLLHYPGMALARHYDGYVINDLVKTPPQKVAPRYDNDLYFLKVKKWTPFDSYQANLVACNRS
jgi:hypothetical protein